MKLLPRPDRHTLTIHAASDKTIGAGESKHDPNQAPPPPEIALLSPAKICALKQMRKRRAIWICVELVFFLVLLALLIVHSFRLRNKTEKNTYARWSSSWVMILLSVLMVVIGLAVVITFYYFRTALSWVLDVKTTDQDLVNPNSRNGVRRSGLSFLQTDNVHYQQQHQQQQHQQQQHQQQQQQPHARCMDAGHGPNNDGARILPRNLLYGVQHDPALMQRPWMSVQGRNSRAWRQMRARQRSSSLSSSATSPTDSDSCGQQQSPRRPPRAARKHQAHARSSQLPGRKSAPQQSSQSE